MTWEGVSVGEKAFAYFLFTVFEIILIAGVVGWCLGWSDKTAPSDPDPNSITYTQMLKNLVNPPPPLPKTAEELEHEERIKALVPGERRAAVDAADVSCFGGGGSSASKGKAMELYKKPSLMEPAAAAAAPPPPPRVKVAKGPGSEGSDKSSSSAGSGGKNAIHKSKSGAKKAQEGGDKDKAPSSGAGKRPPPPKKTAAARKEEVELV